MPSAIPPLRSTAGDETKSSPSASSCSIWGGKWVTLSFHYSKEPLWASELKRSPTIEKLLEHEESEPCYSLMQKVLFFPTDEKLYGTRGACGREMTQFTFSVEAAGE